MSLGTSNRDGGKTSESGHLRALAKIVTGDVITGLNAVQRAAGVNMSVDVQVGDAFVRRSDGSYAHPVFNDAVYNQVISAADGSNPRRDIIVIYVDYGQAPSTAVSNNTNGVVKIKVVNGTPAGSPVDPSAPTIQASVGAGNPYSILARVRVPAGQTSISNSLIDDLRSMTTANISDASVNNAKLSTTAGEVGGAWVAYTPTWTATTTNPTIGNGTLSGYYTKIGKTVHFRIIIVFGTTTNAGSGIYFFGIPVNARAVYGAFYPVGTVMTTDDLIEQTSGAATIWNSTTVACFVNVAGVKKTEYVQHAYPYTWATNDKILIIGTYEAA